MRTRGVLILCVLAFSILACGLMNIPSSSEGNAPVDQIDTIESEEAVDTDYVSTALPGEGQQADVLAETDLPHLAIIGHRDHINRASEQLRQLGEFIITENAEAQAADLVLYTVSYLDGPMPQTRQEIENLAGMTVARAAILGTDLDRLNGDMELKQLVDLDMKELLARVMPPDVANSLPILVLPGEDVSSQLQGLLDQPVNNILLNIQNSEALPETTRPRLALIGHQDHIREAAQQLNQLGEYIITENEGAEAADLVLITISYADGPMPQTRQEIENLQGMTLARVAILYTAADIVDDPELEQLIDLEMRDLLSMVLPSEIANGLPTLELPGPDTAVEIQALLDQEAENILLEP